MTHENARSLAQAIARREAMGEALERLLDGPGDVAEPPPAVAQAMIVTAVSYRDAQHEIDRLLGG